MDSFPVEGENKDRAEIKKLLNLLAHDLKSPIQNVIGFAGLLDELLKDETNRDIRFYINIIMQEAENTLNLIETFKDSCNQLNPEFNHEELGKIRTILENSIQERQKSIINI